MFKDELQHAMDKIMFTVAAILTGLFAVGYAKLAEGTSDLTRELVGKNPLWFFLLTPVAFVLGRATVQWIAPYASGSGIPQIMAALDIKDRSRQRCLAGTRVIIAKVVSSLICMLGGGLIGREGPMVQVSASVFSLVAERSQRFIKKVDYTSVLVAGGAAGIAAAFNAPLGGIIFAVEELLVNAHFSKVRTAIIIGVVTAGMVAQGILGSYLFLGDASVITPTLAMLVPTLIVSILCGFFGGLFGKMLIYFVPRMSALAPRNRYAAAAFLGLIVATGIYLVGYRPGVTGGGADLVRELIANRGHESILLLCHRFFGTLLSFLSGSAGGVFAPSLAIGASLAREVALFFPAEHGVPLILVGMAGFLSAVTRAPFTSIVLVIEMTDASQMVIPTLIASLLSVGISRIVERRSFYRYQAYNIVKRIAPETEKVSHEEEAISYHPH